MYAIKEIFYSLQGEGAQSGRPAIFCRFSGCNLWSGREEDRATAACNFCDTDFRGCDGENGGRYLSHDLATTIRSLWPDSKVAPYVICTGGEPLLQLDDALIRCFKSHGFVVALETNGTLPCPEGVDWICVSPKTTAELAIKNGHELKLVFPQPDLPPELYEELNFKHLYLQPMDGPRAQEALAQSLAYCRAHPQWKLSLQTHKLMNIP